MRKIRIVMMASNLKMDGISTVIMNYCSHLDLKKYDVTIMAGTPIAPVHRENCKILGIPIIQLPERKKSGKAFCVELNKALHKTRFDICHVHGNSATSVAELAIAKWNKIPIRIMHCHTSKCQHEGLHRLLSPVFKRMYTTAFACSSLAGNWIFGKGSFTVIPNGFVTNLFRFDNDKRRQYRQQLGIDKGPVIGHVGQMNSHKNPLFTIKCFEKYRSTHPYSKLLMVGSGRDKKVVEEYVKNSPCQDSIILYGESEDIPGLLSAMDIFVFPSKYEGLGISLLEAQISGLPCLASEAVPRDVVLGNQIDFLPIDSPDLWSDRLASIEVKTENRNAFYDRNRERILKYDIAETVKQLEKIYTDLYQKN